MKNWFMCIIYLYLIFPHKKGCTLFFRTQIRGEHGGGPNKVTAQQATAIVCKRLGACAIARGDKCAACRLDRCLLVKDIKIV
jgi:hypothetical protein